MPFIPHSPKDTTAMLKSCGVDELATLFDEIPAELFCETLKNMPEGLNEQQADQLAEARARQINQPLCFAGAGAYDHFIPAAVWDISTRGEFLTAYTPYQAEASQGSLQLIYEYQSMIANLTAMDVANASLYEGGSALAEAILMAIRANRKSNSKRILIAGTVHPHYRQTIDTIVRTQHIECLDLAHCPKQGGLDLTQLSQFAEQDIAAVVIQQPNFFGCLEDVDTLTDWAHQQNALVIGSVNPTSLALIAPPGEWGQHGADITCGEGQPLGVPLASGGPYFAFMCCKQAYARQMPGRIVGRTVDSDGQAGFVLTLQAREQHIRRAKATSNICTNQGLLVTAATIYMSLLGPQGLYDVAATCHERTQLLVDTLTAIPGVEQVFTSPYFHEAVLRLPIDADYALAQLAEHNILGGYALGEHFPELANCLLVCATEQRGVADIHYFSEQLKSLC